MDCPWLGAQQQLSAGLLAMMFGGGVGLYVRRVGAGRCSSCSSISKALQMGMESDMEYAQGLSWILRMPNGCKVADGGLQGLSQELSAGFLLLGGYATSSATVPLVFAGLR